jgi:hypothetical protein
LTINVELIQCGQGCDFGCHHTSDSFEDFVAITIFTISVTTPMMKLHGPHNDIAHDAQ